MLTCIYLPVHNPVRGGGKKRQISVKSFVKRGMHVEGAALMGSDVL